METEFVFIILAALAENRVRLDGLRNFISGGADMLRMLTMLCVGVEGGAKEMGSEQLMKGTRSQ
jgi:hypothetical protein